MCDLSSITKGQQAIMLASRTHRREKAPASESMDELVAHRTDVTGIQLKGSPFR